VIKAILNDFGRVYVTFWERKDVIQKIVDYYGGNSKTASLIFGSQWGEAVYQRLDTGEMSFQDLWRRVCKVGGISRRDMQFHDFVSMFVCHLRPIESTVKLACSLKKTYKMFAVSNGDYGSEYVPRMLFMEYGLRFDHVYASGNARCLKPKLYGVVAVDLEQRYGLKPSECVVIDDVASYVEAAMQLGMKGVVFNGAKEHIELLKFRLKAVGVKLPDDDSIA